MRTLLRSIRWSRSLTLPLSVALIIGLSACVAAQQLGSQNPARSTRTNQQYPTLIPVPELALDRDSFAELEDSTGLHLGIAVAILGTDEVLTAGSWTSGEAWSTMKAPIAIAVTQDDPALSGNKASLMRAAIRDSDNSAAAALFDKLGTTARAATRTTAVLREGGDTMTTVTSGSFGLTEWSLTNQAIFAAHLGCLAHSGPALSHMANITQPWGLGQLEKAWFKGGWGPTADVYLVRQFGVVTLPSGNQVAVAIAAEGGSFDRGVAAVSRIASWIPIHVQADGPAGCQIDGEG